MITEVEKKIADNLAKQGIDATTAGSIANSLTGLTLTGIGASAGLDMSSTATAVNIDANNRQLHPREVEVINAHAKDFAKFLNGGKEPTQAQIQEARKRLTVQALRQIDSAWSKKIPEDQVARSWLTGLTNSKNYGVIRVNSGKLFTANKNDFNNQMVNSANILQNADNYNLYVAQNGVRGSYLAMTDATGDHIDWKGQPEGSYAAVANTFKGLDGKVINENERHAMVGIRTGLQQAFSTVGGFKQSGPIADLLFKEYKNGANNSPLGPAYSSNAGRPSKLPIKQTTAVKAQTGAKTPTTPEITQREKSSINQLRETNCSFRGDMEVRTINGYKSINEIQIGDMVWAKNEKTGLMGYQKVLHTMNSIDPDTTYVTITDTHGHSQQIVSDSLHPYFSSYGNDINPAKPSIGKEYHGDIKNAYWINAGDLKKGYKVLGSNGEWQVISEVYTVKTPLNSYNLEVNNDHTFFVKGIGGLDGVWVHNKNCIYSVENAKSTEIINGEKVYTVEINGKNKKYISNPNYVEGGTEGPYVEVKTSGRGDKRSYNIVQPNKPVTSVDLDKGVIKAEKGSEGNFNKALFGVSTEFGLYCTVGTFV